jgi:hypothetical protein
MKKENVNEIINRRHKYLYMQQTNNTETDL